MSILVTGGAGYIGSHTCVELLQAGLDVVVLDNLTNSSRVALDRVTAIAGKPPTFVEGDIRDERSLESLFTQHKIDSVIHFAGLKAVGESVAHPLRYFSNNITGTITLLQVMQRHGVRKLVFSSSATVYGEPERNPITEDMALGVASPYGRSKLVVEEMCRDLAASEGGWHIVLLRYFNPVGAHPSGTIGEDPRGIPNNLMPFIMQVAVGRREQLSVFGNNYPTPDGTCVRDYIHVVDLAQGHLAAVRALDTLPGCTAINLGTGRGHSVLEVVKAAGRAVGREIPHKIVERRAGDVTACYADPGRAEKLLGWKASRGIDEMCADSWRWQSRNPNGYAAS